MGIGRNEVFGATDFTLFARDSGFYCTGNLVEDEEDEDGYDIVLHARSMASNMEKSIDEVVSSLPDVHQLAPAARRSFLDAFLAFKRGRGRYDFVDMIEMYVAQGEPLPVDALIVDEAQDLSALQWRAVDRMARDCKEVFYAGDDDQAIYGFIGADQYGFLDRYADEEIVLERSYRCPVGVGVEADKIIRAVKRRRDKVVRWEDKQGGIDYWALPATDLPWEMWAESGKTIMVLVRHKKQIKELQEVLEQSGVPYTVRGYSTATSDLGACVKTYFALRDGNAVSWQDANKLLLHLGMKDAGYRIRDLARGEAMSVVKADLPEVDFLCADWPRYLGSSKRHQIELDALRIALNKGGMEIIGRVPAIDVSTYHGSKGREADIVVCLTDCFRAVWEEQEINPDGEIRLCYVGLTRAKEQAIIVSPQSSMYLRPLIDR